MSRLSRTARLIAPALLALGLVAGLAPSASAAANIVPNPGFEQGPCGFGGSILCGWNELVGAMSQDSSNPHTGSFSMHLANTGVNAEATTIGNMCIPMGPGPHAASFWYRTPQPLTNQVAFSADFYPNPTCSIGTSGFDILRTFSPIVDGAWHQVTGTLTAPPGTGSGFFAVFSGCNTSCSVIVNFDDLDFEAEPTAVRVASLGAARTDAGVRVRWRTASEASLLGFNVYRLRAGAPSVRLNRIIIPARDLGSGAPAGSTYAYVDRRAPERGPLRYRLQAVALDGTKSWLGLVQVTGR